MRPQPRTVRWPRSRRLKFLAAGLLVAAALAVGGLLACRFLAPTSTADTAWRSIEPAADAATPVFGGVPSSSRPLRVLHNTGYWVGYDEARRNPAWVGFRVRGGALHAGLPRPAFQVDERTAARVRPDDFVRSGYDRGHMAPNHAIGSRLGAEAQHETFLLSNICAQSPSLNRGLWQRMEARESGPLGAQLCWAESLGEVAVIVGPVFAQDAAALPSGVEVPRAYYRIVVDAGRGSTALPGGNGSNGSNGGRPRVLAFLVPNSNEAGSALPEHFLASVDAVEGETGLDFMPNVAQPLQEELESAVATTLWP